MLECVERESFVDVDVVVAIVVSFISRIDRTCSHYHHHHHMYLAFVEIQQQGPRVPVAGATIGSHAREIDDAVDNAAATAAATRLRLRRGGHRCNLSILL